MDSSRFDTLVRTFSAPDTRRALLRLVAALPLSAGLAGLLNEESAAGRQRRRPGKRQGKKKRRCAQAGQTLKKGKRKKCCAGLSPDASGRCSAAAPSSPPSPQPSPGCTGLKPTDDLQAAIAAAEDKATLTLCAGTWAVSQTLVIDKDLTLIGSGAGATTLDGGRPPSGPGGVRVLQIDPGAKVTLQDLTITKGHAAGVFPANAGGGIYNDLATLTLIGVSVTNNTATRYGGGIVNDGGTVTLQANSHVTHNTATFGGGIQNRGGGTATLQADSRVSDNTADSGGGIYNDRGTLTLKANSRVTDNTATAEGGGIATDNGTVTLEAGSRVSDNTVQRNGGGIFSHSSMVTVDGSALVCDNKPADDQCDGVASCPNPADGICLV